MRKITISMPDGLLEQREIISAITRFTMEYGVMPTMIAGQFDDLCELSCLAAFTDDRKFYTVLGDLKPVLDASAEFPYVYDSI